MAVWAERVGEAITASGRPGRARGGGRAGGRHGASVASRLEEYALSVIAEPGRPGLSASVLRGFLGGCAGLYGAGLEAYLAAEKLGLRRRGHLPVPVISIGNLSVGGTGKTPMTQFLCRLFQSQGKRVVVLSRGHGGESHGVRLVSDAEGRVFQNAGEAGDEPVLLAKTLCGVPVFVGKDRRESGREALRRFAVDLLVLDDGFQFWQLTRDVDIVLLDARRPFDNGWALPRGLLREPKRHLARASVVVATRSGGLLEAGRQALAEQVRRLAPNAPLFFADHRAVGLVPADNLSGAVQPLETLHDTRVFAVSAIAQPRSFVDTLERAGARVVGRRDLRDHHNFSPEQAKDVVQEAVQAGAECVVMTEKDAVKWPAFTPVAELPTYALRIEMALDDGTGFMNVISERLRPQGRTP